MRTGDVLGKGLAHIPMILPGGRQKRLFLGQEHWRRRSGKLAHGDGTVIVD